MYRNSEGYSDPTAGAAMGRVMSAYKKEQRRKWLRENAIKGRPRVYVVSAYAGDVKNNTINAIKYCQYAIKRNKMPIASHLLYPQMLDDNNPAERELGTMFGLSLIPMCSEVWVFGRRHSPGMTREIEEAKRLKMRIRYFNGNMEEIR